METAGLILVMQIGYPENDQGEVSIKLKVDGCKQGRCRQMRLTNIAACIA